MHSTIRRLSLLAALSLVAAAMTGCAESATPQATGKGNIRGINAIVTAPEVRFLIEERDLAGVNFKQASAYNAFDDLTYDFNFDLLLPGQGGRERLGTQVLDVQADHEYTVALAGSIGSPSTLSWEDPIREWSGSETVFEAVFTHLAPSLGEVDVYFAAPGTVPVPGQAVGSLANGERLPPMEFEAADYELIVTAKDDPSTVIYQSVSVATTAQTRAWFVVFGADPAVPGNFAVNRIVDSGSSTPLPDARFPAQVRTLHAAFGTQNVDGYLDGDFANVVFSDIGFKELSPYADLAGTTSTLTVTPVGNPGATIHEDDFAVPGPARNTAVLAGAPGSLVFLALPDNSRPLETFPVIRFVNASVNTEFIDIYLLEPGETPDDVLVPDVLGLPSLQNTGFGNAPEGMVEVAVTLNSEKTPIATTVALDLAVGDRADIAIVDTVDPTILEIVVFEFQPAP